MSTELNNIKILRERTGVGILECKKVLSEANGDIEKAVELLRKAGQAKAVKKSGRIAAEGLIGIQSKGGSSAIVEINSETDFVARDQSFLDFVSLTLASLIKSGQDDVESLKKTTYSDTGNSLEKQREVLVTKIGENINIRRAKLFHNTTNSLMTYSHSGKIGVVVEYSGGDAVIAKDIAMHVAATNPIVLNPSEISPEIVAKERDIFIARAEEEGTPADKVEMRVQNQVKKFISQSALLGQSFVKDQSVTIEKLLNNNSMEVINFIRYEVGEGIAKKEENFADEVAEVTANLK